MPTDVVRVTIAGTAAWIRVLVRLRSFHDRGH